MQTIGCPTCGDPLAPSTGYCARCGEAVLSSALSQKSGGTAVAQEVLAGGTSAVTQNTPIPQLVETAASAVTSPARKAAGRTRVTRELRDTDATIQLPYKAIKQRSALQEPGATEATVQLPQRAVKRASAGHQLDETGTTLQLPRKPAQPSPKPAPGGLFASTLKLAFTRKSARASLEQDLLSLDEAGLDDFDDEFLDHHDTWEEKIEQKTTHPMATLPASPPHNPRVPAWLANLTGQRQRSPRSIFWLGTLVVLALLLSGAFGLITSFGRTLPKVVQHPNPALQVSPATIALGGIVNLRGMYFTPGADVLLTRDEQLPLVDTAGLSTIQADAHGAFSDTIVVDPAWLSGTHTLYAVDAHTHKRALLPLLVTGQNALQGPPHLVLSSRSLNLGSGDSTTNASQLLALSNAGDGVATWQASVSQSWLQITPQSGVIDSGKHMSVIVAANRAALTPGSHQATIVFNSNTGQVTLTVTVVVTALQPRHEAILQLSRATMDFSGVVGGSTPGAQTITIYNPGILPLTWGASVGNTGWLWAAPSGGTIAPGGQQRVTVGVQTGGLGSGVYKGVISFSNQGSQPVQGSPQSVYVSLTVTPACALTLSSSSLNFTGAHGGASPASKSLSVGAAKGCANSHNWAVAISTTSGGNWLTANTSAGTTPATVKVSAHTAGLAPGTYNGTLTFTSNVGTRMVDVTLTVTPVPCAVSGPAALAQQGNAAQTNLVKQGVTLSASGDCQNTLDWTSAVSGGSWLNAPASGTFTASTVVTIQSNLSGLSAGTYNGSVTITVVDSVTGQTVGVVTIAVTLTALDSTPTPTPTSPPCVLQTPSPGSLSFSASSGSEPATPAANFSVGVTGSCAGNVTITPTTSSATANWLSISGPATVASGSAGAFTVTVAAAALSPGTYAATITLTASGGISGSPQSVTAILTVQ